MWRLGLGPLLDMKLHQLPEAKLSHWTTDLPHFCVPTYHIPISPILSCYNVPAPNSGRHYQLNQRPQYHQNSIQATCLHGRNPSLSWCPLFYHHLLLLLIALSKSSTWVESPRFNRSHNGHQRSSPQLGWRTLAHISYKTRVKRETKEQNTHPTKTLRS